jgi:hypothetical protein
MKACTLTLQSAPEVLLDHPLTYRHLVMFPPPTRLFGPPTPTPLVYHVNGPYRLERTIFCLNNYGK